MGEKLYTSLKNVSESFGVVRKLHYMTDDDTGGVLVGRIKSKEAFS